MRAPVTNQPAVSRIQLYRNGTAYDYADSYIYCANTSYWYGNNISPVLWKLKTGDIIRSEVISGATGNVGFAGNTYVTVSRVN